IGFDEQVELYKEQTFQTIEDAYVTVKTYTYSKDLELERIQDKDLVFVDNAFDYLLAHSFTLLKQLEKQVIEVWKTNDSQVLRFLKEYIIQKRYLLVENTTCVSYLGYKANIFKECSKSNIIETLPLTNISNSIKKIKKGQLPKIKCYQSLLEKQLSRSKGKQHKLICGSRTNICGECSSKSHNRQ
ncbi:32051_t:CDS:2, partial [Racocetra persica]